MEIETKRLRLRAWREEDLQPFARMNADPEVMKYFPYRYSLDETRAWIARAQAQFAEHGWGNWAVELKETATFIGVVGLNQVGIEAHFTPAVEVAWRLEPAHWGQGLATEGARAALDLAFGTLGLAEVVSYTTHPNLASRRVMEKLGMTRDPREDFHHPKVAMDHPMSLCVLYRAKAPGRG